MTTDAEKKAHGTRLKTAMARAGKGRGDLAQELGVAPETVTNWRSGRTMPDLRQMHRLTEILGDYNADGDAVERAIHESSLTEDRQYDVIGYYKRAMREQQQEEWSDSRRRAIGRLRSEVPADAAASEEPYSIGDEAEETERST